MHTDSLTFFKYSGSGNDFVCVDNRDGTFSRLVETPEHMAKLVRILCHRGHGVGADGVILAERPEVPELSDISARFLEADGNEVELCGNGTACFTDFVLEEGIVAGESIRILTPAGVVQGRCVDGDYVRVCVPSPTEQRYDLELAVEGRIFRCDFALVGVPHLVTFVPDIESIDVARWGARLRHHPYLQPKGASVNFVQIIDIGHIAVRTFESGVEAETLACGTGSSASAIMSAIRHQWNGDIRAGEQPVLVRARGGDTLRVYFSLAHDDRAEDVCLETVVRPIFRGMLDREYVARVLGHNGYVPVPEPLTADQKYRQFCTCGARPSSAGCQKAD